MKRYLRFFKHKLISVRHAAIELLIKTRHFARATRFTTVALATGMLPQQEVFEEQFRLPRGIGSRFSKLWASIWNSTHFTPLVIVLVNEVPDSRSNAVDKFSAEASRALGAKVLLARHFFTGQREQSVREIQLQMLQKFHGHDLILLDAQERLPQISDLLELKVAAYRYSRRRDVAVTVPQLTNPSGWVGLFDVDIATSHVVAHRDSEDTHGQFRISRDAIASHWHSAYVRSEFIRRAPAPLEVLSAGSFSKWIQAGASSRLRCIALGHVRLELFHDISPEDFGRQSIFENRMVKDSTGANKIIFVLPATSISGGIRTVFEQADGLKKFGFTTEIWALQGKPDWIDLETEVRHFLTYADLEDALHGEDAIKVATWWETAEVVWRASLSRGIPVNFVQEFESWFYPHHDGIRAAVAASYRREFQTITIASFTESELNAVGVKPTLIPVAYNSKNFFVDSAVSRDTNTVMAVGRSFFQKNFAMTLAAWRSLPTPRPTFSLYGIEPNIATDEGIRYVVRPTDAGIRNLYNQATVFVQTSIHEGFCLPVLEAMASGCPVITTDSHGNRDFCSDEVNSLVVDQGDEKQLAAAISRVLNDKELQQRLREEGLKTAARYTWDVVLESTSKFMFSLSEKHQRQIQEGL